MEDKYDRLANIILERANSHHLPRYLVSIAGVPGSGKTTIAEAVVQRLNSISPIKNTLCIGMDGFHLSQGTLDQMPNSDEAYVRRGAPWTFDMPGFVTFVRQLRTWADTYPSESVFYAPAFDHEAKDPIQNAVAIMPEARIVVLEGNYLLLDQPGWREIPEMMDYRVFVKANLQETRQRLAKRHVKAGIENSLEDALRRVDCNDSLNSLHIYEDMIEPDLTIDSVGETSTEN